MSHTPHVHVGGHADEKSTKTDRFELTAAILLGIAGILIAVSGLQSGMWNGKMSEHYGEANKIATAAAAEKSLAMVTINSDLAVDRQALQQLLEGNQDATVKKRTDAIAGYLYTFQMSDQGYRALKLPEEFRKMARSDDRPEDFGERTADALEDIFDRDPTQDLSVNADYQKEMMAKSNELSAEAEKTFAAGVKANENGDKFEIADVIFAISLFFTGISLVFKTRIRWGIICGGFIFLVAGMIYMATLTWVFS